VHAVNLRWREGANRRRGYIRIPPYTKREEDGGALDQKKNRRRTIRRPHYSLMSKRQTSNPGTVRKKRKGNTMWKTSSLNPSDDEKMTAEDVRVWDISTSENTGHMTARRKNLKHYSKALPPEGPSTRWKQGEVGEVACVEDAGILADSETVPHTTYKQRQKRKRVRTVKENDSVSDHSSLSSLTYLGFQTRMEQWLQHRSVFLDKLLHLDGWGDALNGPALCPGCLTHPARFRCKDCFEGTMHCSACTTSLHQTLPLHRLEVCQVSCTVLTRG
jgi:hypothetical protein